MTSVPSLFASFCCRAIRTPRRGSFTRCDDALDVSRKPDWRSRSCRCPAAVRIYRPVGRHDILAAIVINAVFCNLARQWASCRLVAAAVRTETHLGTYPPR